MSTTATSISYEPVTASCLVVAGARVRVARGVVGRLGQISSTTPGHVLVRYDDGGREVIDLARRPLWVL